MATDFDYILFGPRLTGKRFERFIEHVFVGNAARMQGGQEPVPCCIWGRHGIGKTQSVRDFAARRGIGFVQINPAQFEEMGDITGMPKVVDVENTPDNPLDDVTIYIMPDWAKEMHRQGPEGILLLDDFNRADGRIIRGIMQLLQDRRMVSWELPARWQIFLTANPDGGDYAVTPLDDAVLTRMSHVTLEFDHRAWADWARRAGIDERGIAFVLSYPELVGTARTTPRSLVNFFSQIQPIPNLQGDLDLVDCLARACIDDGSADAFVGFVRTHLGRIPHADDILSAADFRRDVVPRLRELARPEGGALRADILSVVVDRIVAALVASRSGLPDVARTNAVELLAWEDLPSDLRFAALMQLNGAGLHVHFVFEDRRVKDLFQRGA
jgi:hypothetical protein